MENKLKEIAAILRVDLNTLPSEGFCALPEPTRSAGFNPLTDVEWEAVSVILPKLPVPKPGIDYKDRVFVDAALFFQAARERGFSWSRLPPELGPQSSREHRHRRWCLLGYWTDIAEKLALDPRISKTRLAEFERIAEDAAKRKAMLLERRARLTDGSPTCDGARFCP